MIRFRAERSGAERLIGADDHPLGWVAPGRISLGSQNRLHDTAPFIQSRPVFEQLPMAVLVGLLHEDPWPSSGRLAS